MMTIIDMLFRPDNGMVRYVKFKITKTDGVHVADYSGAVMLNQSTESDGFIAFENLSEIIVVKWVKAKLGDELKIINDLLDQQINSLKNPTIVAGLPW
jgi:hypothetical protein